MEARIKVAENEGATLNIYPRAGSGTFYFEIRDCSYKDRGSLGTKNEVQARTDALTRFAAYLDRKRKGQPVKALALDTVVNEFLAIRETEYERGELSVYTLRQNKTVLKNYFLPWMKEQGFLDLSQVVDIDPYVDWRKAYRRDAEQTYMRGGKEVTGQRCAKHFKLISADTINKENNALRVFYRWAQRAGHVAKGTAPEIPMLRDTAKVRTPERNGRLERQTRGEAVTIEERSQEINYGNWLRVEEFAKLRKTAWQLYKWEATKHELSKRRYPWMHKRRYSKTGVSQHVRNWRAFYCWLMIMVNTGMRPVEFRNLIWDRVRPYRFSDSRVGREVWVIGKGKLRPVVVDPDLAIYFDTLARLTSGKAYEDVLKDQEALKGYVFPLPDFGKYLKETLEKAEMDTNGRNQYTLRHTYINWQLLYTDIKPSDLAIIVGNSDRVIHEYYNHVTPFLLAERSSNVVRQHGRFLKLEK
ncbi:MAG: hypothetical protein NVV74_15835 [Magnetospirillum sp.]|nr:hypothetical protein [Magnetospirillum sp.]